MSDERLRILERAWREALSPNAEAAYLAECARVGRLSANRMRLAALAGHEAACVASGISRRLFATREEDEAWFSDIEIEFGMPFVVKAALEIASLATSALPEEDERDVNHLQRQMAAGELWLKCPCDKHARDCIRLGGVLGACSPVIRKLAAVLVWTSREEVAPLRPAYPFAHYVVDLVYLTLGLIGIDRSSAEACVGDVLRHLIAAHLLPIDGRSSASRSADSSSSRESPAT